MMKSLLAKKLAPVMKAAGATIPVAALAMAGGLVLPISPASAQTATQVKFCSDINYGGQCFTVSSGGGSTDLSTRKFPGGGNWNDKISSVKVGDKVRAKANGDANWTGDCIVFSGKNVGGSTGEYPDLRDYHIGEDTSSPTWNDRISSFQVGSGTRLNCN